MVELIAKELTVEAEYDIDMARIQLVMLDQPRALSREFRREGIFWVDFCLTPRRPHATATYVDRWSPYRSAEMGSIIALPPTEKLLLKSAGGKHASLICQLRSEAIMKWLPADFEWTDRRLEACLHIASDRMRTLLLWLNQELRRADRSAPMFEVIVGQLSIELARYILSTSEPREKGGLASWRLRLIDSRLVEPGEPPSVGELADICKLSVRQLTRGFRASRGSSIAAHISQLQIDLAKRRLTKGESIRAVATSLGYASQSAFTYAFRRATGITPDQYRKSFGSEYRLKRRAAAIELDRKTTS